MKKSTVAKKTSARKECSLRFEPVAIENILSVLDAIAWVDGATAQTIAQFTAVDPRTVGKAIKNAATLGIIESFGGGFSLRLPYPPKGTRTEKETVLREAIFKMPLMVHIRQFSNLGDSHAAAVRKAATMVGIENYEDTALAPLLKWAKNLNALDPSAMTEDLVDQAVATKNERHRTNQEKVVAFISHSSRDKPFIRQLSADLVHNGVDVWLDEQKILVGDSIAEKIGQGLAQSDYFVIALSEASVTSEWVKKELNGALIREVEKRAVTVLPILLGNCEVPELLKEKSTLIFANPTATDCASCSLN